MNEVNLHFVSRRRRTPTWQPFEYRCAFLPDSAADVMLIALILIKRILPVHQAALNTEEEINADDQHPKHETLVQEDPIKVCHSCLELWNVFPIQHYLEICHQPSVSLITGFSFKRLIIFWAKIAKSSFSSVKMCLETRHLKTPFLTFYILNNFIDESRK